MRLDPERSRPLPAPSLRGILAAVLLALPALGGGAGCARLPSVDAPPPLSPRLQTLGEAVVTVRSRDVELNGVIASAGGLVFTVSHGVEGDGAWIRLADGRRRFARLLTRSAMHDLAILQLPEGEAYPWIEVGSPPAPGARISVLARRGPGRRLFSEPGQLWLSGVELRARDENASAGGGGAWHLEDGLVHSARLEIGLSGSALLDEEGLLIGINSAVARLDRRHLAFALSAASYRAALSRSGSR